ncbi:hypothetical protein [Kitasatospora sp. NPDC089509]|uniref:hypothetical protein n=1 Tax=Kitasatospora sp. NPDC089509 TaxID=3364079 RepID=UPI0038194B26
MPARNRRLPRHLSWPLTPTDLREALGAPETQESDAADVHFGTLPPGDGPLLTVSWEPRPSSNYTFSGTRPSWWTPVRISVGTVPGTERAATRHALRQSALPELAAWIRAARQAPEAWRLSTHRRSWLLTGDGVTHCGDAPPPPR